MFKKLITVTTFLFAMNSFAGILIEPQVGYILSNKWSGTANLTSGATTGTLTMDYKYSGVSYGGRFGYQTFGLMGGLSYLKSSGKSTDNTDGSKDDFKETNLGAFIGYNAPILLRAWFAYNFSVKVPVTTGTIKGSGTEFGLGYTGLPFLSVNFIYRMYDYSKLEMSGTNWDMSGFKPKEMEIAISAPFNLF